MLYINPALKLEPNGIINAIMVSEMLKNIFNPKMEESR